MTVGCSFARFITTSTLYVRGQHNNGTNTALVIIDGIERPIDDILPEEIESIEVLKDATAKILYGAAATNGVVLVRTKRGEAHKRIVRVSIIRIHSIVYTSFIKQF